MTIYVDGFELSAWFVATISLTLYGVLVAYRSVVDWWRHR